MANYKCEEISSCVNFQSAICLHCNRRLCVLHISEHNKIVFGDVENLSDEVEAAFQHINKESENRSNIYNNILATFDEWRTQQIGKIDQIYESQLQQVDFQQKTFDNSHLHMLTVLECEARQPLENIQKQQNAGAEILNHIRQTIKKVREDSDHLKWDFPILPTVNIEYPRSNTPSTPVPVQPPPTKDDNRSLPKKRTSSKLPSTNDVNLKRGRSLRRLVGMFADLSSIEQSKYDINTYIRNPGHNVTLPVFVCSYLTAWDKKSPTNAKVFLLNEHISTIRQNLTNRKSCVDVIIGIQAFFHNQTIQTNKHEMMTFLLQFFLNHRCITENIIFNWYENKDVYGYKGFEHARELATPFINSISTRDTVENIQTVSIEPTTVDQCSNIQTEQESVILT